MGYLSYYLFLLVQQISPITALHPMGQQIWLLIFSHTLASLSSVALARMGSRRHGLPVVHPTPAVLHAGGGMALPDGAHPAAGGGARPSSDCSSPAQAWPLASLPSPAALLCKGMAPSPLSSPAALFIGTSANSGGSQWISSSWP
jgi:hypothetical protein